MAFVLLLPSYSSFLALTGLLPLSSSCPLFLFSALVTGFLWGEIWIQEKRTVLLPLFWGGNI